MPNKFIEKEISKWESDFWRLVEKEAGGCHIDFPIHARDLFRTALTSYRDEILKGIPPEREIYKTRLGIEEITHELASELTYNMGFNSARTEIIEKIKNI